jgi:hypothetical protein
MPQGVDIQPMRPAADVLGIPKAPNELVQPLPAVCPSGRPFASKAGLGEASAQVLRGAVRGGHRLHWDKRRQALKQGRFAQFPDEVLPNHGLADVVETVNPAECPRTPYALASKPLCVWRGLRRSPIEPVAPACAL